MKINMIASKTILAARIPGLALIPLCVLSACGGVSPPVPQSAAQVAEVTPLTRGAEPEPGPLFRQLSPAQSGIDFTNLLRPEHIKKYLYNGSGVAVADVDQDGLLDVFLASTDGPNRLFRQISPLRFEDITEQAGLARNENQWSTGVLFFDANGDGWQDLFICNLGSSNRLYLNQGDGRFREASKEAGLAHTGASVMAAVADYDRDGDLDLYLLTNRVLATWEEHPQVKLRLVNGRPTVHPDHVEDYAVVAGDQIIEAGQADILYRNDGSGRFSVVTERAGISGYDMGLSATWWDYNDDGWPDLYVANDMATPDHLYRNNRDGSFTDISLQAFGYTSWFSMGADFSDIDNDGAMDFMVGDMSARDHFTAKLNMGDMADSSWFLQWAQPRQYMRNVLYRNTGTEAFQEVAFLAGLDSSNWTWALRFGDMDNDGREDLFVTNGMERATNDSDWSAKVKALLAEGKREEAQRLILDFPRQAERNLIFRNAGDLSFAEVGQNWGITGDSVSHGAILSDLDGDGDLDLLVNHLNEPAALYENTAAADRVLQVSLQGPAGNPRGIGAQLSLKTSTGTQLRQLYPVRGYLSGDTPIAHFGLGEDAQPESLQIRWPDGREQQLIGLQANHRYGVRHPARRAVSPPANKPHLLQHAVLQGLDFRHRENAFDDYAEQPLLPWRLSTAGPGMAWADFDGDGQEDVWIGGAAGQAGALYRNHGQLRFEAVAGPWVTDAAFEDTAAAWLDVDGDGRLDLYVVSGGVETSSYRDRLYLNTDEGFVDAAERLPEDFDVSGRSIAVADIDGDGDIDAFVGGYVIAGRYPASPDSHLLINENGRLRSAQRLPLGQVNAALWADLDGQPGPELVLAGAWQALRFFRPDNGRLVEWTDHSGQQSERGWWTALASGDIDGDGDLDLVAGNVGLNTKYHASADKPVRMYASDFDDSGGVDLVEAKLDHGTELPIRGRSCSAGAMPFIAERFPSFRSFAAASLQDIYPAERLGQARRLEVNALASVVLMNEGDGRFSNVELPRIAQIAPAQALALTDLDSDGRLDLVIAQNFYGPQPETGHWSAGLGQVLLGDGSGAFTPLRPDASGFGLRMDARALATPDLDQDGRPDLVVAGSNAPTQAFISRSRP